MRKILKISVIVTVLAVVSMPVIGQIKENFAGNVGIGTFNPIQKLHVYGDAVVDAYNVTDWGKALCTKVYTKSACAYLLIGDGNASEVKQMILMK
jgi:hypothetical protein